MSDTILEPPGTIAVVGAGPLGIEAALYGRFLGYNVSLIEAVAVGNSMSDQRDAPMPMLPDRCLSPLALSAINAQHPDAPPFVLPTTIAEWIDNALIPLTETDLLRDRLKCPALVSSIGHVVPAEDEDDADEDDEPVPPDFALTINGGETIEAEAVILVTGASKEAESPIELGFQTPAPYFFQIGQHSSNDVERDFLLGLKEIVGIYAQLADRENLDLYVRNPHVS